LESGDFAVLSHGLKRIYRRGRQRMRAAKAEPTAEALHEWRKRVKELWYASQIVAAAAPERMDEFSKRAHRLSELLGEDHDLAVLRAYVKSHSGCFADESPRRALEAVIDRRRECLQREAFELGPKVYRRRPRRFAGSIERSWRKAR
jgi:CHAD domain-containing protein